MSARAAARRCMLVVGAVLSFCATLSLASSSRAYAASNGQWSVFPTTEPGHPPRAYVTPTLNPGKPYVDSVTVANYTGASLTFNLYGADAINTAGDGLSLRRRTDIQIAMGKWITLPYAQLTVAAHSATVVPFSILPPEQASPGDYLGGIVAEDTQGTASRSGSVPITVIQAVGVRIYGRISGPLNPRLGLSHTSLTVVDSAGTEFGGSVDANVKFTVRNSGNTILSPATNVVLTTPFGTAVRRAFTINQLLPGNSLNYSLRFPGVSAYGHLRAQVIVTGEGVRATGVAAAWVLPWGFFVIVLVVVVLLAALLVHIRRRRNREAATTAADGPGSDGAEVVSVEAAQPAHEGDEPRR